MSHSIQSNQQILTTSNKNLKELFENPDKAIDHAIQSKWSDVDLACFGNQITDQHIELLNNKLKLKSLTINSDQVTKLHNNLKTIKNLNIDFCINIKKFPEGFHSLKTLSCKGCSFTYFPESMSKLKKLDIRDTFIVSLPALDSLRSLVFNGVLDNDNLEKQIPNKCKVVFTA